MNFCNLNLKNIELKIIEVVGKCKYKKGSKFKLTDLIKKECYFALHEAIPYLLTLKNNGYFKWERNKAVTTQCPHTKSKVAIRVTKKSTKVISIQSNCPKYKEGDEILINKNICLTALDVLFPYILLKEPTTVRCPFGTIFRLEVK